MRISTIGGVVSILGVVDSGLYGGGMASLYHLVADLQALHRQHRGQHTHQKEEHTDMKIHKLSNTSHFLESSLDYKFFLYVVGIIV